MHVGSVAMGSDPPRDTKMWRNEHAPGNMAVLVNAPTPGLRTWTTLFTRADTHD